jgi:hypothetical protein
MMRLLKVLLFLLIPSFVFGVPLLPDGKLPFGQIVIPLEGVLLQGVQSGAIKYYSETKTFSVTDDKRYFFAYRPGAQEFVAALAKAGVKIFIASQMYSETTLQQIVTSFEVPDVDNKKLSDLISGSAIFADKKISLAPFKLKENDTLIVWTRDLTANAGFSFGTGDVYYNFENFKAAQDNAIDDDRHRPFFATSAEAWRAERNKVFNLYLRLFDLAGTDPKDLKKNLQAAEIVKPSARDESVGLALLDGSYTPEKAVWAYDAPKTKILGCELIEARTGKSLGPTDVTDCFELKGNNFAYQFNDKNVAVACQLKDAQGFVAPASPDESECRKRLDNTVYAYQQIPKGLCTLFTSDLKLIGPAQDSDCSKTYVIFSSKLKQRVAFDAFKDFEKLSADELEKRVAVPPPTLDSPIRMFEAWKDKRKNKSDLAKCISGNQSFNMLVKECRTDTLYSWGDETKLNVLAGLIGKGAWLPIQTIFASRGPISTVEYGPIQIRVKLRKGIVFTPTGFGCAGVNAGNVGIRTDGTFSDWTICSPDAIHSWSVFMPEHYDEIIQEYMNYKNIKRTGAPMLGNIEVYAPSRQAGDIFFGGTIDGRGVYSEDTLKGQLAVFLKGIKASKGKIFYNPQLPAAEKTREAHFSTDFPTHFNEN